MADLDISSTTPPISPETFAIRLEFEPHSGDPSRIFRTMTGLIEACKTIDMDLVGPLSIRVDPFLVLEDVQTGSLTARLSYLLKSIDDEALASLEWKKILGAYLVRAKRRIVQFLDRRPTITDAREIYQLQDILDEAASEARLPLISLNSPVPAARVADDLRLLSEATVPLLPGDSAQLVTDEGPVPINTSFRLPAEAIEQILTRDRKTERAEMILMVKKPDFLGESMWDFRHNGKRIPAKVLDNDWLRSFHGGAVPLRSGDALRAVVEVETNYGKEGEVVGTHYRVLNVLDVIPRTRGDAS